jgi:hypothetical protein
MAAFSTEEKELQRLDLSLLQNSPIALYYRPGLLHEDLSRLRSEGYTTDEFDCSNWHTEAEFHTEVAVRLAFPGYYGGNLDAFHDCIGDVEISDSGGRAFVLHRVDSFARCELQVAQHILDILASASWRYLLFGRRLLTLVQSDDPRIQFEPVGAHPALWNPREQIEKNRGL